MSEVKPSAGSQYVLDNPVTVKDFALTPFEKAERAKNIEGTAEGLNAGVSAVNGFLGIIDDAGSLAELVSKKKASKNEAAQASTTNPADQAIQAMIDNLNAIPSDQATEQVDPAAAQQVLDGRYLNQRRA